MQASDAYLHHVLRTTLMSLDILEQQSVITPNETGPIRSKLQATLAGPSVGAGATALVPYGTGPQRATSMAAPSLPPRQASGNPAPDAGLNRAVAQWDYNGTAPDDLNFHKGDVVVIDKEANNEWYHGHLLSDPNRSGLFPANYVQRLPPNGSSYPSSPLPPHQSTDFNEKASFAPHAPPMAVYSHTPPPPGPGQWQPGPPPMMYGTPPPPQHPQQLFPYNPPAPPQVQQQAQPPAAPGVPEKKPKFGKLGGQLGNSFANGAGFGAGAAVGSGIVNAIF